MQEQKNTSPASAPSGRELIKAKLQDIPTLPGVYKMLDDDGQYLYIGKAKNLKNRISSYARLDVTRRIGIMISKLKNLEYVICSSEAHALIMEAQLIKKNQPKFNILLKDDKSFPYIKLRTDHEYGQLVKYRGKNLTGGEFFGPFASAYEVDKTLSELQKIFKLRSCSDHYFAARKRPCLQYQIQRCSAPCTQKISKEEYIELVSQAKQFLLGKTSQLQKSLIQEMKTCSKNMEFEKAANIRDRIKALSYVQLKSTGESGMNSNGLKNIELDVICAVSSKDLEDGKYQNLPQQIAIQLFMYRAGQSYGGKCYFPRHEPESSPAEIIESFIGQFYQTRMPATEIIISHKIKDIDLLTQAIEVLHGKKIKILSNCRTYRAKLLQNAIINAKEGLKEHLRSTSLNYSYLAQIKKIFALDSDPLRIEIYDNSHIMGSFAVGAMVVATPKGFDKNEYRIFNIKDPKITKIGDDYAMLRHVLTRRVKRILQNPITKPDLMIIDGGEGHKSVVEKLFAEFSINIKFVCMSKGPNRHAGEEIFHTPGMEPFTLDKSTPVMKYLQIMRDEVHNFAIKSHRKLRSKAIKISNLDKIDSIGPTRKKQLLEFFGSVKAVSAASIDEIAKIENFDKKLATKIYNGLRRL